MLAVTPLLLKCFKKLLKAGVHVIGIYQARINFRQVSVNFKRHIRSRTNSAPDVGQLLISKCQNKVGFLVETQSYHSFVSTLSKFIFRLSPVKALNPGGFKVLTQLFKKPGK